MKDHRTYKIKMPVTAEIYTDTLEDGSQCLTVWLDGDLYDGLAPPVGAEAEIIRLIKSHGKNWVHEMPREWWAT